MPGGEGWNRERRQRCRVAPALGSEGLLNLSCHDYQGLQDFLLLTPQLLMVRGALHHP